MIKPKVINLHSRRRIRRHLIRFIDDAVIGDPSTEPLCGVKIKDFFQHRLGVWREEASNCLRCKTAYRLKRDSRLSKIGKNNGNQCSK